MRASTTRASRVPALVWIVAIALVARVVTGAGYLGYDAAWALVWGGEVTDGAAPSFTAPFAPTPHPLAVAVSALLHPFGAGTGGEVVAWLTLLSLAAALWFAGSFGTHLYGRAVGGAFAL